MKKLAVLLAPLLCLAAGNPPSIDSAIEMAKAVPGEFAADALIRLSGFNGLEAPRKAALLEEAFRRAAESPEPYRRRAGMPHSSEARFIDRASDQDLDALTLRLRVVEALLPLDRERARKMFLEIPPIRLPKLTCSDSLVYDVSRYYDDLGRIAAEAYTPAEMEKGEPWKLLLDRAAAIDSAAQVAPMAQAITRARAANDDFRRIEEAYAAALGKISGDDRTFTWNHSTGRAIFDLVEEIRKRGLPPFPVLEAYRLYLVTNLSAARCADDDQMLSVPQSFGIATGAPAPITDPAEFFNLTMRLPPLQPIEAGEIQPAKVEGSAEGLKTCEDDACRKIAKQLRDLIFQENGAAYQPADRKGEAWQANFKKLLTAIAFWQPGPAGAAAYFRTRCGIYSDLLAIVPTPENESAVIQAAFDFVASNRIRAASPVQWFLPINAILARAEMDPNGIGRLIGKIRESKDPVIALYAALSELAPRKPEQIMPLF